MVLNLLKFVFEVSNALNLCMISFVFVSGYQFVDESTHFFKFKQNHGFINRMIMIRVEVAVTLIVSRDLADL